MILQSMIKFSILYKEYIIIWVWRSLVARVNGVHEAGGSNPLTQTILKIVKALKLLVYIDSRLF